MNTRTHAWMGLPLLAGLLLATTIPGHTAPGDTIQTTGGGWIVSTYEPPATPGGTEPPSDTPPPSEAAVLPLTENNPKATFGFVASGTEGDSGVWDYHAELTYHDHSVGLRLKCLNITGLTVVGSVATFTGDAEVTTAGGSWVKTFTVTVEDNGEPGKDVDKFTIHVNDFMLDGEVVDYHRTALLGGGNIQTRL